MKLRSFLAFDIPPKVQQTLGACINDLKKMAPEIAWSRPDQLHVTLRFFGSVDERLLAGEIAAAIRTVTQRAAPTTVECAGLGVFPNWKYPRIIWAGFGGDTEPILTLHERLHAALAKFPLKEDDRAFRLHLTIGRARRLSAKHPLVKTVESLGPIHFGAVPINRLTMYKSQLTRTGAVYTPIAEFPLSSP